MTQVPDNVTLEQDGSTEMFDLVCKGRKYTATQLMQDQVKSRSVYVIYKYIYEDCQPMCVFVCYQFHLSILDVVNTHS